MSYQTFLFHELPPNCLTIFPYSVALDPIVALMVWVNANNGIFGSAVVVGSAAYANSYLTDKTQLRDRRVKDNPADSIEQRPQF